MLRFSKIKLALLLCFTALGLFTCQYFSETENTITIDFSFPAKKTQSVVGFLHVNDLNIVEDNITQLKPKFWRLGNTATQKNKRISQLKILQKHNITPIFVLTDLYSTIDQDWQRPFTKPDKLLRMVEDLYSENGNKIIYDVWNEPNMEAWKGTREDFFNMFKKVHDKIRSLPGGNDAVITGPSITGFDKTYMEQFLEFCQKNKVRVDVLNWHENGVLEDAIKMQEHINYAKNILIKKYPLVGIKNIYIPEILWQTDQYNPLTAYTYLYFVEKGGAAGACKSCWDNNSGGGNNCFDNSMDGILDNNGKPRSIWWVYKLYANSLEKRLNSKTDNEDIIAIPYFDKDNEFAMIIGNISNRKFNKVNINLNKIFKTKLLGDLKLGYAKLYEIPNSEMSALSMPKLVSTTKIKLSKSRPSNSFSLNNLKSKSLYSLVISKNN